MKAKVLKFPLLISVCILAVLNIFRLISGNRTIFGLSEYATNAIVFFTAFVAIIVLFVLSRFVTISPRNLNLQRSSSTILFSIASLLIAVAIIVNVVDRMLDYLFVYRNIIQLVLSLFGILACVTFVLMGIGSFKNINIFKNKEYLTLFPVFWCIIRLYERYTVYSATSNLPWEMADEILIILGLLFFLYQAKIFANIESKNKFKNIITFGYSYIIFYFTFFNIFIKNTSTIESSNDLIDTFIFLFVISFILIFKSSLPEQTPVRDVLADDFDEKFDTNETSESTQNQE